ncbi:IPT/TIG domain-containing protein [Micromonospora sp. NPDC002717]|uniref:IPT/TIG domain-containing protein n=1 Tax=Micromonospora sp. NPDC002717 TaxID=3154424 RepID=UPI0033185E3C
MPDAPRLDTVTPASAPAGTPLTLAGTAFGDRTEASAVRFRVPDGTAAPVIGTVDSWSATGIVVRVPSLVSFGSGGPLEVVVHTDAGDSAPAPFVIEEAAPPAITTVDPARGLENTTITVTGERFGRRGAGSTVLFRAPGPRDVPAFIEAWTPTAVTVQVPALTALDGAGDRPLVITTAWGRTEPAAFLLGELPQVTGVVPSIPAPGATITVQGRAFGTADAGSLDLVAVYATPDPRPPHATAPTILSWTDTEIRAELPDLHGLLTTGSRDVIVTSEWGPSLPNQPSRILIESRASITSWTRLEPHARTSDLQQGLQLGLQAQVYDALWLLGRQWQMRELRGSDAGSPVAVRVEGISTPLARWRPANGQPDDTPTGVPLEAVVERERVIPPTGSASAPFDDLRLAAEAGLHLLRLITANLRDARKSDDYRARFLRAFPLQPPADPAALDTRSRRFLAVTAGRAPDGGRIYAAYQGALGANPTLPNQPPINGNDRVAVLTAVRKWYAWCAELFSEPVADTSAWDRQRMEYAFAAGSGDLLLAAPEHDGGHLDWYSFSRRIPTPATSLGAPAMGREPEEFTRVAIPNPVSYPGMPMPRWWELEDGRVDFGSIAAAPSDLLTLVLVEFATVYGNDWFTVPLDALTVGALCELTSVTVTDAFGVSRTISPFGDGAGTDWRMFELASDDGAADAGNAMLLLDALPTTQESRPLEDVLLLRDEMANMAWAVEKTVQSRTGRPLDLHENEVTRRAGRQGPDGDGPRRYLLQTPVPRNWVPLLPRFDRDGTGSVTGRWLARGAMREPDGGAAIPPRGRLLEPGTPLEIYDEEVPRTGVRLTRLWTLGRSADGRSHLWRARRKGPGRGEGSSGIRFDTTTGA